MTEIDRSTTYKYLLTNGQPAQCKGWRPIWLTK